MSKGEDRIEQILKKEQWTYKKEYSFSDLTYKTKKLRFDFAIFIYPKTLFCLIEFDGVQHFQREQFFHSRREFLHMQENDRRKNNYCIINKIPLYRIPFCDYDKLICFEDLMRQEYIVDSIYHNDRLTRKLEKDGLL